MLKYVAACMLSAFVAVLVYAHGYRQKAAPGLEPFTPTRMEWLTTSLQASLREDSMMTDGFTIEIAASDSETVLIYVRYTPDVNREKMNLDIDTARKVIEITAKSYGWDKWVRIKEDVQLGKP